MATMNLDTGQTPPVETDADRKHRIAWEAERIAEARASLDAGLYVDSAEIGAWIASIGTDNELPPPPNPAPLTGLASASCPAR